MVNKKEYLKVLVERAMQMKNYAHMRPVIEKELLHFDILFVLDKENLLDQLTFQGGTALRLCYGAQRFSEDLDFTGGTDFKFDYLIKIKECIEFYIGERYGLEVSVKEPKELAGQKEYHDLKVKKWQVSVTTSPKRKYIPKQKIKIEVCNVPSYSKEPRGLLQNYDFLPDSYADTLIMVETLDEIMADKLISFVNTTKYIRNRDIWDLNWLRQNGAKINLNFLLKKIQDYKIVDYTVKINNMLQNLEHIIHGKEFKDEMTRFTPQDVQERTIQKKKFFDFLTTETKTQLLNVKNIIA